MPRRGVRPSMRVISKNIVLIGGSQNPSLASLPPSKRNPLNKTKHIGLCRVNVTVTASIMRLKLLGRRKPTLNPSASSPRFDLNRYSADVRDINGMHATIFHQTRTTVLQAIILGGSLAELKSRIPHGSWLPYVRKNFIFSHGTALRYMALHRCRDLIRGEFISVKNFTLSQAYHLLASYEKDPDAPIPVLRENRKVLGAIARAAIKGLEGYASAELQELFAVIEKARQDWVAARPHAAAPAETTPASAVEPEEASSVPEPPLQARATPPLFYDDPLTRFLKPGSRLLPPAESGVDGIVLRRIAQFCGERPPPAFATPSKVSGRLPLSAQDALRKVEMSRLADLYQQGMRRGESAKAPQANANLDALAIQPYGERAAPAAN